MTPAEAKSRWSVLARSSLNFSRHVLCSLLDSTRRQMFSDHSAWRRGWRRWARGRIRMWSPVTRVLSARVFGGRTQACADKQIYFLHLLLLLTFSFLARFTSPTWPFFFLPPRLINIYRGNNTWVWTIRIIRVSRVTRVQYLPPFCRKGKPLHQLCAQGKVWLFSRGRVRKHYFFFYCCNMGAH